MDNMTKQESFYSLVDKIATDIIKKNSFYQKNVSEKRLVYDIVEKNVRKNLMSNC